MPLLRTHYANLKIARDAPPEIVKAAYRALSTRWHPDRNPGNPDAVRIMALINESYAVLSDPDRRAEHDRWILRQELRQHQAEEDSAPQSDVVPPRHAPPSENRFDRYARMDLSTSGARRAAAACYREVAAGPGPKSRPAVQAPREPLIPDLGRTLLILAVLLYLLWLLR